MSSTRTLTVPGDRTRTMREFNKRRQEAAENKWTATVEPMAVTP